MDKNTLVVLHWINVQNCIMNQTLKTAIPDSNNLLAAVAADTAATGLCSRPCFLRASPSAAQSPSLLPSSWAFFPFWAWDNKPKGWFGWDENGGDQKWRWRIKHELHWESDAFVLKFYFKNKIYQTFCSSSLVCLTAKNITKKYSMFCVPFQYLFTNHFKVENIS